MPSKSPSVRTLPSKAPPSALSLTENSMFSIGYCFVGTSSGWDSSAVSAGSVESTDAAADVAVISLSGTAEQPHSDAATAIAVSRLIVVFSLIISGVVIRSRFRPRGESPRQDARAFHLSSRWRSLPAVRSGRPRMPPGYPETRAACPAPSGIPQACR